MQFERFCSLNQSVAPWFLHLPQAGFQPTLTNLRNPLWWLWWECEAKCPFTSWKGAQTPHIGMPWTWDAVWKELAMFKEFASGGVKHQKSFWTAHLRQCLTAVCKPSNLCRPHCFAETCKTDWFSRGSNEFGGGNVVSDTFVQWLVSGEEHKWGRCTKKGMMGDGLMGRKGQQRQQRQVPRLGEGARGSLTTLGEGALLKLSHWGVAWKQGRTGAGDPSVEAAGLGRGLQEGTSNHRQPGVGSTREINLVGSWGGTLGRPGNGVHVGRKAGGACRSQDSKMSWRLAIASTWEYLWEAPPLQGLRRKPEGHGRFDPLWTVQRQRGGNGGIWWYWR